MESSSNSNDVLAAPDQRGGDKADSYALETDSALDGGGDAVYQPPWVKGAKTLYTGVSRILGSTFYQDHCIYMPAMVGLFVFSRCFDKVVRGRLLVIFHHFPCPILLTSIYFLVQWVAGFALCAAFPITMGTRRVTSMTWKEWLTVSVPCGLVPCGDSLLSFLSVVYITISFYTMVRMASAPIFVVAWAYLFGVERITWALVAAVAIISLGRFLTVVGEVDYFDLKGFLMCLSASVLSGARWTLVQLKLQTLEPPLKSTVATMRLLAPSMFFPMLFLSFAMEQPWVPYGDLNYAETLTIVWLGLLGGIFQGGMILCEYHLILHSSALVVMIGEVIKSMITIYFLGDEINAINAAGYGVVFCGFLLYKASHHYYRDKAPPPLIAAQRDGAIIRLSENLPYTIVAGADSTHQIAGNSGVLGLNGDSPAEEDASDWSGNLQN